jgi:hypothetical protein
MKKIFSALCVALVGLFGFGLKANAVSTTYIDLNNISLKEYSSLESFLTDYNSDSLPNAYVTNFLYDGVAAVKTPDLDDFIEAGSNDTKVKTLEIKVINIVAAGTYQLSGEITGAMIAVNTNNVNGNIDIVLNNASIDTDSKKAPAVYVYNKDKNYTGCKVTIKTLAGTKNYLEGGKLKKVSLLGSDELSKYSSYYSGDAQTNYNTYSNYYGIYTSEQIEKILFATVKADNEDLQDGDPLYFYKASGAVSSDIDLYFEGEGFLSVTSKNKEGIETKGNLTFDGGTGDYEVYAQDDCLNTTTANSSAETVRNDIAIDVASLLAKVSDEADEGDAIDSNGKLTINGGKIWAYAHPTSGDAGLDSVNGTYINNGTVIATGNMADAIANESKQKYIYASLNTQVKAGAKITIKDQDDNTIVEFETDRSIKTVLYSSADLDYESYKVYVDGTEVSYNEVAGQKMLSNSKQKTDISSTLFVALMIEIAALIIAIGIAIMLKRSK